MADDTPNYDEIKPPAGKAAGDYTYIERRSEIYRMIEEAGHPRNLRRNQSELAKRYGVSQQQISKDMDRLREYQRERSGDRAVSNTRWLGEKTITSIIEQAGKLIDQAENLEDAGEYTKAASLRREAADLWDNALSSQMEYNDFLFKLGQLDEAPDELHISGDAGEVYMEALKQAHSEQKKARGEE